jgi:hypothetical protein
LVNITARAKSRAEAILIDDGIEYGNCEKLIVKIIHWKVKIALETGA